MKWISKILAIVLVMALKPDYSQAADLPSLPGAPNIKTGILNSGIKFYLAVNQNESGRADIALIQKVGLRDEDSRTAAETIVRSRESISDLPHFNSKKPYDFISGIASSPNFLKLEQTSTVYHFRDINLRINPTAVDSTLLMIFDIIATASGPLKDYYAPENQAIVVAGDVDAGALIERMNMLSLLVPIRRAAARNPSSASVSGRSVINSPSNGLSSLSVIYSSARTPGESMATILPLVSQKMAAELGMIIQSRFEEACRKKRLIAKLSYDYLGSAETPDDEQFVITVSASSANIRSAVETAAYCLAGLSREGVDVSEYISSQSRYLMGLSLGAFQNIESNSELLQRCLSSFLYGSSLADEKAVASFFSERVLDEQVSTDVFNSYISSVLGGTASFIAAADPSVAEQLSFSFKKAWSVATPHEKHKGEVLDLSSIKPSKKLKIKSETKELLSGGKLWTFENGIEVLYKQSGIERKMFQFNWLLKGGFASLQNLQPGEGAHVSQMLRCSNIAGVRGDSFLNLLLEQGIELDPQVTVSDMYLRGTAPSDKLALLLQSFIAMTDRRSPDALSFNRYREKERLIALQAAGTAADSERILDSLSLQDSPYTAVRRSRLLSSDFQQRAEKYFERQFSKMNDGVLLIVGNLDEEELKKTLSQYLGAFSCNKSSPIRMNVKQALGNGRQTVYGHTADRPSLDIAFSAPSFFTIENYLSSSCAVFELRKAVSAAAAEKGWYLDYDSSFEMFPEERIFVNMYLRPMDYRSLPGYMLVEENVDVVMGDIRKAVESLAEKGVSDNTISGGKFRLNNILKSWNSHPVTSIGTLRFRYTYGKDMMSNQDQKIAGITPDRVNAIIKALAHGRITEYAVRAYPKAEEEPLEEVLPEPVIEIAPVLPYSDTTGLMTLYNELFVNNE